MSMIYEDKDYELDNPKENDYEYGIILVENEPVNVYLENELMFKAEDICEKYGYTLDKAIEKFVETVVEKGELPFGQKNKQ